MPAGAHIKADEMGGDVFNIRWSKQDRRDNLPERFKRAIDNYGSEPAKVMRRLARAFVEAVEKEGPAQINEAVTSVAEKPAREYAARSGKGKTGK